MWILLGTVFVASLLGSLHCVGMCGPFALMAGTSEKANSILLAAAYSFGRLVTYTIVGVVFGSLGMVLNQGTSFAPWQQTATFVAGGLMIVVGLIALARHFGWKIQLPNVGGHLQKLLQRSYQTVTRQTAFRRAWMIGALSCLMPCGWLYTFAIVAAGTGSPIWGAVVMVVFWSGTVPIMVSLMFGFRNVGHSIQQRIPVTMASLVIITGLFTLVFRAPIAIGEETKVVDQTQQLINQVRDVEQAELPCCKKE